MTYDWLVKPNAEMSLLSSVRQWESELLALGHVRTPLENATRPDVLVSVGGDGTLLHAARLASPFGVPVLGINQGHLGFLTSLGTTDVVNQLTQALQSHPIFEERLVLSAKLFDAEGTLVTEGLAINDVVLRSADHLMTLSWAVDEKPAALWRADGVIVSTPTGSTAYNLSAGGAILEPELQALTVTPLCPQTLTHRPMVISAQRRLSFTHSSPSAQRCALDGQDIWWVQPNHRLLIEQASCVFRLCRLSTDNFYSTLRQKLGWNAVDSEGFPLQPQSFSKS